MGHTATVDAAPGRRWMTRIGRTALLAAALLAAPAAAWAQEAARAATDQDTGDPPSLRCVDEARVSFSAAPAVIVAGQQATLSWSVQVPSNCEGMRVFIDNVDVGRSGSMSVAGIERTSAVYQNGYDPGSGELLSPGYLRTHYVLNGVYGSATGKLATTNVDVRLPVDAATGRPKVTITANHQVPLLLLGLNSRRAEVFVQNHVELDLTGYEHIYIAGGVKLFGRRSPRDPGPLLYVRCTAWKPATIPYCSSAPNALFQINSGWGETIRISGLRIRGVDAGNIAAENATNSHGIVITSAFDIEIDNNEISGWRSSAIQVTDDSDPGRICHINGTDCPAPNSSTIRIRNNYIHHNQQNGTDGYGVAVVKGAYALIEKNVFDYNRHAIATDGSPGSGYLAYNNLVLEHGGFHENAGVTIYTHQFDIHGTRDCDEFWWIDGNHNCGPAGEYTEIKFNSFFYLHDNAFKLRGTPSVGVTIESNVFAHQFLTGFQPALGGYVDHITTSGNRLGINENGNYGHCDFDHDGVDDEFLATGQTWWFRSGGRHWNYLSTSTRRLHEVQLGDFDGDGRCDVMADGVVSSGGTGRITKRIADLVWKATTGTLASWEMDGATVAAQTTPGTIPTTWQLAGRADLRGDGRHDLVWRDEAGQLVLWQMAGGYKVGEARTAAPGYTFQGSGDFDADGADDLLWRDAAGRLVIRFRGERVAPVSGAVDAAWVVGGVGDFDGDGRADVLWCHGTGALAVWHMVGAQRIGESVPNAPASGSHTLAGVGDFDADGIADILWRDTFGVPSVWFGGTPGRVVEISAGAFALDPSAQVLDVRDYTRDGRADVLWQDGDGRLVMWVLAGGRFVRADYPRQPLRGWVLALAEGVDRTRNTDPSPDDNLPLDCFKRCL